MKSNKKKIVVLSVMMILLVASAVLNVWLNNKLTGQTDTVDKITTPTVTETFGSFRSSRESARQELFDYLDAIIQSDASTDAAVAAAETQKQGICTQMEDEILLESLIKSRGFTDVVVTLSDSNCTVVVADDDLQSAEVAQIYTVVASVTDYLPKNTVIFNY